MTPLRGYGEVFIINPATSKKVSHIVQKLESGLSHNMDSLSAGGISEAGMNYKLPQDAPECDR